MTMVYRYPTSWLLAGLVDEEVWMLERHLPARKWTAPVALDLDTERDRLVWRTDGPVHEIQSGRRLLGSFVLLWDAPPTKILQFARRWGVIEVCEHHMPQTHDSRIPPLYTGPSTPGLDQWADRRGFGFCRRLTALDEERGSILFWEPLAVWRRFSAQAAAILNLAAAVFTGQRGSDRDWLLLDWPLEDVNDMLRIGDPPPSPDRDPRLIGDTINTLLALGDVRPIFDWNGRANGSVTLGMGGWSSDLGRPRSGLFGAIATNLLFAVARSDGLAICSGCGQAYSPGKKPSPGRRNYCERCKENKVPLRDAARDYRARKRIEAA